MWYSLWGRGGRGVCVRGAWGAVVWVGAVDSVAVHYLALKVNLCLRTDVHVPRSPHYLSALIATSLAPLLLLLLRSRCCVVADAGDKSKSKLDGLLALTGVRLEAVQRPWVSMPAEDRAAVMRKLKAFSIAATVASSPGALRVRAVLSCGRAGEGASWRVEAGIWPPFCRDNRVGVGAGVLHLYSRCDFIPCVK